MGGEIIIEMGGEIIIEMGGEIVIEMAERFSEHGRVLFLFLFLYFDKILLDLLEYFIV